MQKKNATNPMQAHMDKMGVEEILSHMTEEDKKLFERIPERCEYAAHLMSELAGVLEISAAELRALLKTDAAYERSYLHQCWDSAAANMHYAEQLLWRICDASWYNRNDALNNLSTRIQLQQLDIKIVFHNSITIIKCPYLSTYQKSPFTLTEDLLMAKLSHIKDLPRYKTAFVSFVHVYPMEDSAIPKDVGNYYYRRAIDLLAAFFGFSDSAQCYAMSMSAIFSDSIPKGTYIIIDNKQNPTLITDMLASHFSAKS